jgi:dTDP-4-dehydrorhamnose 3,5-epimerase-like enzyme
MKCCRRVELPEIVDQRGGLTFAEADLHVPFGIRRMFAIYSVPPGTHRGGHAHRRQHQFIIMMNGAATVSVDEGADVVDVRLEHPTQGLYVPPMVWIDLRDFTPGTVCLVLTSDYFDEADYIRDYAEFRRTIPKGRK